LCVTRSGNWQKPIQRSCLCDNWISADFEGLSLTSASDWDVSQLKFWVTDSKSGAARLIPHVQSICRALNVSSTMAVSFDHHDKER
jgi:hypothetical protein